MGGFISGESILDQLVTDGNIDALDYLFHERNSNLWFSTKVTLVFFYLVAFSIIKFSTQSSWWNF